MDFPLLLISCSAHTASSSHQGTRTRLWEGTQTPCAAPEAQLRSPTSPAALCNFFPLTASPCWLHEVVRLWWKALLLAVCLAWQSQAGQLAPCVLSASSKPWGRTLPNPTATGLSFALFYCFFLVCFNTHWALWWDGTTSAFLEQILFNLTTVYYFSL